MVLRSLTRDGGKTAGKVKLNDFFYVGAVLLQGISLTVYELDYGNIINLYFLMFLHLIDINMFMVLFLYLNHYQ